jgi:hypothetical protein
MPVRQSRLVLQNRLPLRQILKPWFPPCQTQGQDESLGISGTDGLICKDLNIFAALDSLLATPLEPLNSVFSPEAGTRHSAKKR